MKGINVYSEIGKLTKVLVHRPGDELRYVTPQRIDELLMSAIIEFDQAQIEHDAFTKILKDHGVEVVELAQLSADMYDNLSAEDKNKFIDQWIVEASWGKDPLIDALKIDPELAIKVKDYLLTMTSRKMMDKMMAGILLSEINEKSIVVEGNTIDLVVDPMPNIYFTRDPFASVGNGITLHNMKYPTRKRETIFAQWIFNTHPDFDNTPEYYARDDEFSIEGGDVFIYNNDTLALGVSERTTMDAIKIIAKKIMNNKECHFKRIICVNVPPMGNLMHLDTWLTMVDKATFLYSGNIAGSLKVWEIDLVNGDHKPVESSASLPEILAKVVGQKVTMVPIGGNNGLQMDIDIETHFDGTNYLVIAPGVVVGYDRNKKTQKALEDAGVKVIGFNGNQLSLGMGSSRCMSMPLWREEVK